MPTSLPAAGRAPTGPPDKKSDSYRVEALGKGLRILALFGQHSGPMRLTEVSRLTGVPMPTAYRLVHTLVEDGFLERLPEGQVQPGPVLLAVGISALHGLDLVQIAGAPLRELARRTGQTVNLGVLRGDRIVYLERLRNSDLITANLQVGSTAPAYCTSMGKLLLALSGSLSDDFDDTNMGLGHGPNAARSRAELERRLLKVSAEGYAVQDQEFAPGLRSIAGPIRDATGAVVAAANLVVQAPNWSVKTMLAEYRQPLMDTCADISRRLGYRGAVS